MLEALFFCDPAYNHVNCWRLTMRLTRRGGVETVVIVSRTSSGSGLTVEPTGSRTTVHMCPVCGRGAKATREALKAGDPLPGAP